VATNVALRLLPRFVGSFNRGIMVNQKTMDIAIMAKINNIGSSKNVER
jgi:hypothetical protein